MEHLPRLITDLGLILAAAAVITLLFKRLKQPIVLGYIIAGMLVGPHVSLFPSITDNDSVEVWAQIGVIFLLFSLGLEFSFKKLLKVGGPAAITAIIEVSMMTLFGYMAGKALGWTEVNCIFLGAMLSISSTTIIIRTFDELGIKGKKYTSLVFGILVIQDLVAIVMLVLLPAFAVKTEVSGLGLAFPVVKLVFFLVLWFVSGIFFLPTLLRRAGKFMNDEMLLITSLALCFIMVILASSAGFSPALGAFVMGSILADTMVGAKIERLTKSIKELFGAVFFISVGMMIDPKILPLYWHQIMAITVTVMIAQPLSTIVGALLSGQPLKISIQAGMSLSQIGEFSFIIATLGQALHVTNAFLYPVVVAVSAFTTFSTPYMVRLSAPVHTLLDRILPERLKRAIARYSAQIQSVKSTTDWQIFVRSYLVQTAVFTTIILAIMLVVFQYIVPMWLSGKSTVVNMLIIVVTLLLVSPFIWALTIRHLQAEATIKLRKQKRYGGPLFALHAVRVLIAAALIGFLLKHLLPFYLSAAALAMVTLLIMINYKRLQGIYYSIEKRFITNFNEKERSDQKEKGVHLVPWDAHITHFILTADFSGIGKTLMELQIRERFGVNIAMIKRGFHTINVPDRNERVYPEDHLHVIGNDEQIEEFKKYLAQNSRVQINYKSPEQEVSLVQVSITAGSEFIGKTIKSSNFREQTKGLIVGIEKGTERILNPESSVMLELNDVLWVVGNKKRLRLLIRKGLVAS